MSESNIKQTLSDCTKHNNNNKIPPTFILESYVSVQILNFQKHLISVEWSGITEQSTLKEFIFRPILV